MDPEKSLSQGGERDRALAPSFDRAQQKHVPPLGPLCPFKTNYSSLQGNPLATDQVRETHESGLTAEQKARVESVRAKHHSPGARAEEALVRVALEREYRETGSLKTTGDGTTMADLVVFRRFIMSLRRERERAKLSLNDVAERAKIDKAALSRLESGQQLNPTVNTLTRHARALGKCLTLGLAEPDDQDADQTAPNSGQYQEIGPRGGKGREVASTKRCSAASPAQSDRLG